VDSKAPNALRADKETRAASTRAASANAPARVASSFQEFDGLSSEEQEIVAFYN
jgi:hypothetical protein